LISKPLYPQINPVDYLALAKELAAKTEESAARSAVDRAYYAAFLTSRDVLTAKNYLTPYYNYKDHEYVTETLRKVLGSRGNDEFLLHNERNRTNYDTRNLSRGQSPDIRRLSWIINTAEEIIGLVQALPENTKKP
jgi:hypothetical protein